jgi:phosphatidylserine decarboxylase
MHAGAPLEGTAPAGEWRQISIFLSVADVHINRTPYGGEVTDVTYRPGRYHAAFKAESAHENERSEITVARVVGDEVRTVVFRQIVGVMARRVVTRVVPGQVVRTGERIGLMKFGSRMDVFVPPDVELLVEPRQKVVAGETLLARWSG